MSFVKRGTFGKNYAKNIDKNVCPTCGRVLECDKTLKSELCQCNVSNDKKETDCEELNEEHKN